MKHIIVFLTIVIAATSIIGYYTLNPNPFSWEIGMRVLHVIIIIILYAIYLWINLVTYDEDIDD